MRKLPSTAFKRGQAPWNKGIPMSAEARQKTSASKKGQVPWSKGKKLPYVSERNRVMNLQFKKEGNPNWKGGKSGFSKKQALIRDNYTCQECKLQDREIVLVDHIKPKSVYPELRFEISNLITLCPNCHARKTNWEKQNKVYGRWAVTVEPNTIYFNPSNDYITHT